MIENALNPGGALTKWRECISVQEQRVKEPSADPEETRLLAVALNHAAELVGASGSEGALELYRRSEQLFRILAKQQPADSETLRSVVEVGHDLAILLAAQRPAHPDCAAAWARVADDLEALAALRELTAHESEILDQAQEYGR